MPLLRTPTGEIVSVPANESDTAEAGGYTPVGLADAGAIAAAPASEDRGVLGGINAAATGLLSGATLGGSDYLLKGILDQGQFDRLAQEREGHPIASGVGQVAGAVLPAFAAPESLLGRAPAGVLGHATADAVAAGRALGGAEGLARSLAASGIEGAAQNAGMYLSDTALGDRELSAEGLAGALGPGFAFGAAGGVAALGIEQGTIAARRLFSRAAGTDKAAEAAASAWQTQYQAHVEVTDAAADIAKAKLATARAAREQAQLAKQRAVAAQAETRARAMPGSEAARTPAAASPVQQPVEVAGLLNDRAMAAMDPARLAAWDAANGPRLAELMKGSAVSPITLEDAAVAVRPKQPLKPLAAELEGIPPMQWAGDVAAPLSPKAEEELATAVAEHDGARAELEDVLRRLEAPDIEPGVASHAVPISEFGEPGQRGVLGTPGPHEPMQVPVTADLPPLPASMRDVTRKMSPGEEGLTFDPETKNYFKGDAPVTAAPSSPTKRIEVVRTGAPRDKTFEARMPDGRTVPLNGAKREPDDFLLAQMPPGFKPGVLETHRDFSIEHGLPASHDAIADNAVYIARPSELVDHGVFGNELKTANRDSVLEAWKDGERLNPIDIDVPESGKFYVDDGNHRLQAAARDDRPVAIRFRKKGTGSGWKPQAHAEDITERIRADLPGAESTPARAITSQKEFRRLQDAFRENLTPEEIKQSLRYTREDYNDVNRFLRGDKRVPKLREVDEPIIPTLDAILEKGATADTLVTHRAAHFDPGDAGASLKPGDVWTDQAYQSTSYRADNIGRFGNTHFVITSPPGTRIAPVPSAAGEGEFLLARNSKLRITSRSEEGGKVTYHATVEPVATLPAATNTLTGQMRSMQERLGAGESLNELGAPARAEYAAAKSERTAAASEHFRARANAENYAGSQMGAAERAAQIDAMAPFHEPVGDLDAFFRDLTAPKTRDAYVAANIGRAMREEGSHAAALAKVEREWAAHSAAEAWAERAATLEYDGGYSRADAERLASDEVAGMPHGPGLESARSNPKRVEAARKAAAASVERRREIHSAVASNLPQELQTAWNKDGYKFLQQEAPRIRGMKDRVNASSKISEAFTEQYGSGAETLRGYEGDRYHRRAEIESKHAELWANEQERKYYAAHQRESAGHPVSTKAVSSAVEDIAAVAKIATKYEKASARLTEALGAEAPPAAQEAAKAFREAESHSERKAMERTTRAIDDHASAQSRPDIAAKRSAAGPVETSSPDWLDEARRLSGKTERTPDQIAARDRQLRQWEMNAAKSDVQRADVGLGKARIAETEARIGARGADQAAAKARAAMPAPVEDAAGGMSRLGAIATTIGVAGELGVPGLPRPHDIPVIGPLLGMYLKYRAIKAAAGRFVGRIPATGDARAAALVSRTKDKIARAVDRTLGLAEAAAPKVRGAVVAAATVLGHRAFDDGEPDAPKGATTQQLAAVRIREIANAATRPDLVTAMVRKELRGVTDPDLIAAAEKHLMARYEYLNGVMPKQPAANPYTLSKWVPTPGQAHEVAQRLEVVHDPESAFTNTTPAKADTLRNVSPRLLQLAQERLIERVSDIKEPVPYQQRLKASLLFGVQLDSSLDPQAIATFQSAHAANRASPTPQPASPPPTSSIAADTNLNAMYQTGMDRRAMR